METSTTIFNNIDLKFEKYLQELGVKYEKIDFDDDDLNYKITMNVKNKIRGINELEFLVYLQKEDSSIHILLLNIYNLIGKDVNPYYKKINIINADLDFGKFIINEKLKQIVYSDSIYCGSNFKELSEHKIKILLDGVVYNLIIFLKKMSSMDEK